MSCVQWAPLKHPLQWETASRERRGNTWNVPTKPGSMGRWASRADVQLYKCKCWLITTQKLSNSRCNDQESEALSHSQLSKGLWDATGSSTPGEAGWAQNWERGFDLSSCTSVEGDSATRLQVPSVAFDLSCLKPFHFVTINIHWAGGQGNERWNIWISEGVSLNLGFSYLGLFHIFGSENFHPGSVKSLQKNVLGKLISPQPPTNAVFLVNHVVQVNMHS